MLRKKEVGMLREKLSLFREKPEGKSRVRKKPVMIGKGYRV